MEWNKEYHGISINYKEHIVHIKTDSHLLKLLGEPGNDSVKLARHLKETYQLLFGKELNISEESLSVEILIHTYLDVLLRAVEKLSKRLSEKALKDLIACMKRLEGHTEIIDCGEREVDSNRHIFDSLASYRHLIYGVLGKRA